MMRSMAIFDIRSYGARGDGRTNDAPAIQAAIDACATAGGGTVLVPAGAVYLTGSFALKGEMELRVERGARLLASPHKADYNGYAVPGDPNGVESEKRVFIRAYEAHNLAITGGGIIDGNAKAFMTEELPHIYRGTVWRPHMMVLVGCDHLTIRDITLRDAGNWTLHMSGCHDVLVDGIRILNDLKVPNCDGIDPDHCTDVRISNCHIEAGDDCIVLKNLASYAKYGPTRNITITNCTLISTSAAIKIGTESVDDFRDIVVSNCTIRGSSRGLSIQLRDQGNVENVLFENCVIETRLFHDDWWGKAEPIYVTAAPRTPETKVGSIRRVRFRNIICRGEAGAYIAAIAPATISDVVLEGIDVDLVKTSKWPAGMQDLRPGHRAGLVAHRIAGVFVANASDVRLREVRVRFAAGLPAAYGPVLEAHNAPGIDAAGLSGDAAHPGEATRLIDDLDPFTA
jgi:polygalacturonase